MVPGPAYLYGTWTSYGSKGAIAGARAAAATSASRMAPPMKPRGFRRANLASTRPSPGRASSCPRTVGRRRDSPARELGIVNPRVQPPADDVYREIDEKDGHRIDEDDGLDQCVVPRADGVEEQRAHAGH